MEERLNEIDNVPNSYYGMLQVMFMKCPKCSFVKEQTP